MEGYTRAEPIMMILIVGLICLVLRNCSYYVRTDKIITTVIHACIIWNPLICGYHWDCHVYYMYIMEVGVSEASFSQAFVGLSLCSAISEKVSS